LGNIAAYGNLKQDINQYYLTFIIPITVLEMLPLESTIDFCPKTLKMALIPS